MKKRVSVVMAVYNGGKYLDEQIESILKQLDKNDELIISVDPSVDKSKDTVDAYSKNDRRVKVYVGPGEGVINNFQNALCRASGDYIFLSDQDDVWQDDKIERCLHRLRKKGVLAVIHDCVLIDGERRVIRNSLFNGKFSTGILINIIKNRYTGCCMAFKKQLLKLALPFPNNLPMHDQWLGIVASKYGKVEYIDEPLILYRRHGQTVTGREGTGVVTKMRWRASLINSFLHLVRKARHEKY